MGYACEVHVTGKSGALLQEADLLGKIQGTNVTSASEPPATYVAAAIPPDPERVPPRAARG